MSKSSKQIDLLVIGTGPAASRLATKCAENGWRVAIAEKWEFGGTCALRGCNPKKVFVHAAGDPADTDAPPLTPVANQQGRTIVRNLLDGNRHTPDYGIVPSAVFTVPALASVGLTEQVAHDQGYDFDIRQGDMSKWSSVKKVGQPCAAYQILVERKSDAILGAHLLGPRAEETINPFALAMKSKLTVNDIKSVLMVFPTFASDTREML